MSFSCICLLNVHFKFFHVLNFNTAGLVLLNIIAHFTFLSILLVLFLEEFLKKCWKSLKGIVSKCQKSRGTKKKSGAEAST